MKSFLLSSLLLIGISLSAYGQSEFEITVFGTAKVSKHELASDFNKDFNRLFKLFKSDSHKYEQNRDSLSQIFITRGNFSFVNIEFFTSYSGKTDLIIDFVDTEDSETRLKFRPISKTSFSDLDDLFKTWREYQRLSFELFRKGEIKDKSCPVIHCIWSFNHDKLEPYLSIFNKRASEAVIQLIEVLNSSSSIKQRAASSFLLSHAGLNEQELLNILIPSTSDSSSLVKNNSMRVIYYILRNNPELDIDLERVIAVLNYPSFTDRNKALIVLRSLALENLDLESLKKMIPTLIEILEKKDAHNFRNAHLVLQKISGLEFSYNQILEWKSWATPYL